MAPLRVAFVAPSLKKDDRGALQAGYLLRGWKGDRDVDARLVRHGGLRQVAWADIVHVFLSDSLFVPAVPAIIASHVLGRPVILSYQGDRTPAHLSGSAISRMALARVKAHVVSSSFLFDVFGTFGIRTTLVPNLVDPAIFTFRERHPLRPRLLSTRSFEPLDNVAATIRAFKLVQERRPEAELTLVGGGSQERHLRALAAELELRNLTFAGRVKPADVARFYADNDIYVQSPNIDNMPTPVFEAFASGLPVVSTEAGGVRAVLAHRVHGLLAPLADYETLGHHVLRLLESPDYARGLARAAYATCDDCTWPTVRNQWVRAYRSALPATTKDLLSVSPMSSAERSR